MFQAHPDNEIMIQHQRQRVFEIEAANHRSIFGLRDAPRLSHRLRLVSRR